MVVVGVHSTALNTALTRSRSTTLRNRVQKHTCGLRVEVASQHRRLIANEAVLSVSNPSLTVEITARE